MAIELSIRKAFNRHDQLLYEITFLQLIKTHLCTVLLFKEFNYCEFSHTFSSVILMMMNKSCDLGHVILTSTNLITIWVLTELFIYINLKFYDLMQGHAFCDIL